jgi:phosphoribosyl 1,2-cyclic phosphodiesterase
MRIKVWGARGSTPTPERRNSRYGGNTTCIEIRLANGTLIILDCGSGIRGLGKSLGREFAEQPIYGYVFLTHFHWDHIQGIPFFLPLYKAGNVFLFHSVLRKGLELKEAVEGQMANPYFPVNMSVMGATRHFYELDESPINLNGAIIRSCQLNHPQGCVGYRIEADGGVFVLATDTEPGSAVHDRALRELARGADVLVYDGQYTPEQLRGEKKGWGHSSWLEGTTIARECGVKHLVLTHHDPENDDLCVDGLVEQARQVFSQTSAAAEGMEITLPKGIVGQVALTAGLDRRRDARYRLELPVHVRWQDLDGGLHEIEGVVQDVSRSGVYFLTPTKVTSAKPLTLDVVLPDEITRRGNVELRLVAEPIRQEQLNGKFNVPGARVGIAARRVDETDAALPVH